MTHQREGDGERRAVHQFLLINGDGTVASFDPIELVHVAGWLRHAAQLFSRRLGHEVSFGDYFIGGHDDGKPAGNRRLSYVPAPSITDGRLRRVLVVEPLGAREPRVADVVRALSGAELRNKDGEFRAVMRHVPSQRDSIESLGPYLDPAMKWSSVTPMLLPGHDDRRSRKAADLVRKALKQGGYDTSVVGVDIQEGMTFAGGEAADSYRMAGHLRNWPRVHAVISFAEPVAGPLVIGTGRHYGLGLFSNLEVGR